MTFARASLASFRAPLLVGAVVFFTAIVANAPASLIGLAAARGGPSFSNAEGTIWDGKLSGVSMSGAPLGDVEFRLSFMSLLRLSPQLDISAKGGAVTGNGRISFLSAERINLKNVDVDISLRDMAPRGVFGEPAIGRARINIRRLAVGRRAGCEVADGEVWTDVLDSPARRFSLPALPLAGTVRCEDAALLIALSGENSQTGATLSIKVDKALTYEIVATASPVKEDMASALRVFGFEDDNGGLTYGSTGVLSGVGS